MEIFMMRSESDGLGDFMFRFVVIADTHINEQDGTSTSPFQSGKANNSRARHVFREIAGMRLQPNFVVHLGDIVHPVPSLPEFQDAVARYKEIAAKIRIPVHVVPGNHDVGDKRIEWAPADQVCDTYLQTYREAFGHDYFAFSQSGIRFIFINSLLINSGLEDESVQRSWLEAEMATLRGERAFFFMHYPPYIYSSDERGNYDNLDEPGRSWLLNVLRKNSVEAVFAGHVHNFWYDRIGEAEFYMLPSTAFLRHDFTEFYRVGPKAEYGRADVEKFGYFIVDAYKNGHVAQIVRTMGEQAGPGLGEIVNRSLHLTHPKRSTFEHVGVELRHPWTERMQIAATGGVQEFGRKWARNDYPLQALWEMGIRLAKVPDTDLLEDDSRGRMHLQHRIGFRFVVTTVDIPKPELLSLDLREYGVFAFEVNATWIKFDNMQDQLRRLRKEHAIQLYFSKIHTFDDSHYDGNHFSHFVKSGISIDELEKDKRAIIAAYRDEIIDGVSVRIESDESLLCASEKVFLFARETGCRVLASLKTSGQSIAVARDDDRQLVLRTAQAMILSKTNSLVDFIFDTFMDVDRGYCPRNGFIDRRFDPRPAAKAFALINALFSGTDAIAASRMANHLESIDFFADDSRYSLIGEKTSVSIAMLSASNSEAVCFNLMTGLEKNVVSTIADLRNGESWNANETEVLLVCHT